MISPFTPVVIASALTCVAAALISPWLWLAIVLCVFAGFALLLAIYDILDPVA